MDLRIFCLLTLISLTSAGNEDFKNPYRRQQCPHGYFRLEIGYRHSNRYTRNCYRFSSERTTWHVARLKCQEQGGFLAIIGNQEESDAITNYLMKTLPKQLQDGDHDFWISVQDISRDGYFKIDTTNDLVTTPTNRTVSFQNWEPDEPNARGPITSRFEDADCVRLNNDDTETDLEWGWADWDCNETFFYLCEARADAPFTCNTEYLMKKNVECPCIENININFKQKLQIYKSK